MRKLAFIGFLLTFTHSYSQDFFSADVSGEIYGEVLNSETNQPLEFASVALLNLRSKEIVDGVLTDASGRFVLRNLSFGGYILEISFIGFEKKRIDQILILPKKSRVFLGEVVLQRTTVQLDEVTVSGQREDVVFKADRKVIAINNIISATGFTLVEALETQPSIKTDIDGNLVLRGSPNFTVLVNGRPMALKGSDALQQIPANTVKSVEIITNPSARYDTEGEVGIINIITKVGALDGTAGLINVSPGVTSNGLFRYSSDGSIEYSKQKALLKTGYNYNYSPLEGQGIRERITLVDGDEFTRLSDLNVGLYRRNFGLNAGIQFYPIPKNIFNLDVQWGGVSFERDYNMLTVAAADSITNIITGTEANKDNQFISMSLYHEHLFDIQTEHKLTTNLFLARTELSNTDVLDESIANEIWVPQSQISGQVSNQDGLEEEFRLNIDYYRPLNEEKGATIETGVQSRIESITSDLLFEINDENSTAAKNNSILLNRNIHSYYLQLRKDGRFSYQLGVRPELTDRSIEQESQAFEETYFNVFPSANFSYRNLQDQQFRLGYSMRIRRPGLNQLNPFVQLIDERNQRQGNVELMPEYIHSTEFTYTKGSFLSFFSAELFYRQTENKISPVWTDQGSNFLLLTYDNLSRDYSLGTELMLSSQIKEWWRMNISTSIYRYNINGEVANEQENNSSNSWNIRLGSMIRIKQSKTAIQFNGIYNSEVASAQGSRDGFFALMLGVRQPLINQKLDVTLLIRDVFSTIKFANESSNDFFTNRIEFSPYTPIVSANVSFRFNDYKKKRFNTPSDLKEIDFQNEAVF